jgi:hypothetical protein
MDAALASTEQGLVCGAEGELRGTLTSIQLVIQMRREQFARILAASPDALNLLRAGSKSWCRVFESVFPAAGFTQPGALPALIQQFVGEEPEADARTIYIHAASFLSIVLSIVGQKGGAQLLIKRSRQVGEKLTDTDFDAWSHIHTAEAAYYRLPAYSPSQSCVHYQAAVSFAEKAGNRWMQSLSGSYLGLVKFYMGHSAEARQVLQANLVFSERP